MLKIRCILIFAFFQSVDILCR